MKVSLRGSGTLLAIIIALAVIAVVAVILGLGGFGFGGGKGDGEGDGEAVEAIATVSETEASEITTEEIEYINITISENNYLYQNKTYTLDELISELNSLTDKMPVKLTDDNASQKAYSKLTAALEENRIRFIEGVAE